MKIEVSDRLKKLPPYLFGEIDSVKREAKEAGRDIIDLGVGDPDQPTPDHIVAKLYEAAKDPVNHHYALDQGMDSLRESIAKWYERRFGVELNPQDEILPLIGSKEGISHIPLAFVNPGDIVLIPDPCYPPYRSGTIFSGGIVHDIPLLEDNSFLPDVGSISQKVARSAKIMFLNYPNNPTAAIATEDFFKQVIDIARYYNIIVCHDAAYSEIFLDNERPISFLQVEGAKEVGVEFHSLSKTYCMTGWRIGWVCGNSKVIAALAKLKSNIDSGIFPAIQLAGIAALNGDQSCVDALRKLYSTRRDILVDGLNSIGWDIPKPKATFYVWAKVPKEGYDSTKFTQMLLKETGIIVTPGVGFGKNGEGYVRIALTVSEERLKEAAERLKKIL